MATNRSGCLLACFVLALSSHSAGAAEYLLRPEQSELSVLVFKAGFASGLAHDHVVRATRFAGAIRGDPSNPAAAEVRVTVPVEALSADEPDVRKAHGLGAALDDADRRAIQTTMLGETQLHAAQYPAVGFRSIAVTLQAPGSFLLTGDFSLHGTTRRISIPVTAHLSGGVLRATGAFDFNQSDFGITPLSRFFGAVRNQDRVRVVFDLVATP